MYFHLFQILIILLSRVIYYHHIKCLNIVNKYKNFNSCVIVIPGKNICPDIHGIGIEL